jgi:hypothetical protein
VSVGAVVLEVAATHFLPALAWELGAKAVCHAARSATRLALGRGRLPESQRHLPPRIRSVPAVIVVSETPGRVRFQVASLRGDQARAAQLEARLRRLAGVRQATVSAVTGSALVEYDSSHLCQARIRAALESRRLVGRSRAAASPLHARRRQLAIVGA